RRNVQILRLIDDQHGVLTGLFTLDEEVVQRDEPLGSGVSGLRHSEVFQHVLEELVEAQARVHDERDRALSVEALTQSVKQRRLSRSYLAGENDEAFSLLGPVEQLRKRLAVPRAHVEKFGVGSRVERLLPEPVERQIHSEVLTRQFAPETERGSRSPWRRYR